MPKKALHIEQVQATKDELQLAVERVVRPLIDPLVKEIEALRLSFSVAGKSELMTTGEITKEYGLPRSLIHKYAKEGKLTQTYFHPTRYKRDEIVALIHSKQIGYITKLSKA